MIHRIFPPELFKSWAFGQAMGLPPLFEGTPQVFLKKVDFNINVLKIRKQGAEDSACF